MIKIVWNAKFKKRYKKWSNNNPELINTFKEKLDLFEKNPFHTFLKTHSLTGTLKGFWALRITFKFRLVFKFADAKKDIAILVDIGSHDEVY